MQGVNQQQPSPSVSSDSLSALAFLGQQLRQYSNSTLQQRHQNQPLQSSSLGFALGVNGQEQNHGHQNHHQPQDSPSMLHGGVGGQGNGLGRNSGGMFQHLQQQHGNMNSNVDQFGGQMMNSSFAEGIVNQSMVEQNVQGIMEHLSMLQERITQLQALVPLILQTAHSLPDSNVIAQQQAASAAIVSIISQLAIAAIGLLPQQSFGSNASSQSAELLVSQLLQQPAVTPAAANFLQQSSALGNDTLRVPQRGNNSLGDLVVNSIFGTSGASGSGAIPNASSSNPGLRSGHAFLGMNNEADLSGQRNLTGQQSPASGGSPVGVAMSLLNQMTSDKDFGRGDDGSNKEHVLNNAGLNANNFTSHDLGGGLEDFDNDSFIGEEDSDGENLPPGSFDLVELEANEILAEHTHFCEICGKGFKRDANLRMHMRGHGDEYKTPAALARPDRGMLETAETRSRRFSCPYVGCKRNKKHRKFQPLKTMLCVKNHYRRSHCPKVLTCQKCMAKKFSVMADLKTHEKHCGRDKWLCSCGTTFSRKDKLFGHIGLFAGHTPVLPQELDSGSGGHAANSNVDPQQESPTEGSFGSESKSSVRFWD